MLKNCIFPQRKYKNDFIRYYWLDIILSFHLNKERSEMEKEVISKINIEAKKKKIRISWKNKWDLEDKIFQQSKCTNH